MFSTLRSVPIKLIIFIYTYMSDIEKSINEIGEKLVKEVMDLIIKKDKIATGRLLRSIDYKVLKSINGFTIQLLGEPYLMKVNDGQDPGTRPAVSDILSWVKAKPVKFGSMSDQSTAFIIARSIERKGIQPTRIVEEAIDNTLRNIDSIIRKGIELDIEKILNK